MIGVGRTLLFADGLLLLIGRYETVAVGVIVAAIDERALVGLGPAADAERKGDDVFVELLAFLAYFLLLETEKLPPMRLLQHVLHVGRQTGGARAGV